MNIKKISFPSISILIPTLNSARVLEKCLVSIAKQNYPKDKIKIIVADGGSTDRTLVAARRHGARIIKNEFKTGEAGKYLALKAAKGDLVAFIDSDNVLPDKNWLRRMIEPFGDPDVIGSEPWEYTYRRKDGYIDRYSALMGVNDPYCYFVGNYDRRSLLSGKWTGLSVSQEDRGQWLKVCLRPGALPTIGANGTIMRQSVYREVKLVENYFVDIDVIAELVRKKPRYFAKVKTGIVHRYCGGDLARFIRKQTRRVKDYHFYRGTGKRAYPWGKQNLRGILRFCLSCITMVPLLYQSVRGYLKKSDKAWFFHPIACLITFWVYASETLVALFKKTEMNREKWEQ